MTKSSDSRSEGQIFIITAMMRKGNRFLWQINQINMGLISLDTVVEFSVAKGQRLTLIQLQDLLHSVWLRRLYDFSFYFLKIRARSVAETQRYLKRKLYALQHSLEMDIKIEAENLISQVIQKLQKTGYLNDQDFVKNWLTSQMRQGKLGKTRMIMQLSKLGISRELILNQIKMKEEGFEKQQYQALDQLLTKFFLRFKDKGLSPQKLKQKLLQRLIYRGFNYQQVTKKIDVLLDTM